MRGYLAIVLSAILTSTIGIFVKLIGGNMPIMTLNFFRLAIGFLFIALIIPFLDKNFYKVSRKDIYIYILIGFFLALGISLFNAAMLYTSVANVVLIGLSSSLFSVLLAKHILKEKISKDMSVALVLAFIGLFIINSFNPDFKFGSLLAFISALLFSIAVVYMRYEDKKHDIGTIFWFTGFATLFLAPMPFIFGVGNLNKVLHLVIPFGLITIGLAYIFLTYALEKLRIAAISIIGVTIEPIAATLLAYLILNEALTLRTIFGGMILVLSVIYLERKKLYHIKHLK